MRLGRRPALWRPPDEDHDVDEYGHDGGHPDDDDHHHQQQVKRTKTHDACL